MAKIQEALADGKKLVLTTRGGNSRVAALCHRRCEPDLGFDVAGTWAEAGTIWDALAQLNLSLMFGPWTFEQMYGVNGLFPTWWMGYSPDSYGPLDKLIHAGHVVDVRQTANGKIELTVPGLDFEIEADSIELAFLAVK
ncbi:MAG: hypothetical protein WCG99_00175 [Candidatus Berkelbacteria bacterium]